MIQENDYIKITVSYKESGELNSKNFYLKTEKAYLEQIKAYEDGEHINVLALKQPMKGFSVNNGQTYKAMGHINMGMNKAPYKMELIEYTSQPQIIHSRFNKNKIIEATQGYISSNHLVYEVTKANIEMQGIPESEINYVNSFFEECEQRYSNNILSDQQTEVMNNQEESYNKLRTNHNELNLSNESEKEL